MIPAYGEVTPQMNATMRPFIKDREVWDLGAGSLYWSRHLLRLGARSIIAVDKAGFEERPKRGIRTIERYFAAIEPPAEGIEVAWVSWPQNNPLHGLVDLLEQARVVIYLGCNTDGSSCGGPGLWGHLTFRTILAHVPHRRNSLIIYGETIPERRLLVGEEVAATTGLLLSFEKAQQTAENVKAIIEGTRICPNGVGEP